MIVRIVFAMLCSGVCFIDGFPQFENSRDLAIGDSCNLHDGSPGQCSLDIECPNFIDLWKQREIVSCGFSGRHQIICCKKRKNYCDGIERIPSKPVRLDDHIIRGERAEVAEFPHFASLGYQSESKDEYEFKCGGALISDTFVLTAAHCCNRKSDKPLVVRLGKTSLKDDTDNEQGQDIKIENIKIHDAYSSRTNLNDIALLKLLKPAKLSHNIWPACVTSESNGLMKNLTLIGFGRINNDDQTTSDWLLKASGDEISLNNCRETFKAIPNTKPIENTQVCVLNPTSFSDTCQGDSGGPLGFSKANLNFVYGVTSYGYGCGSTLPSIYTRVDKYIDWIEKEMNK